MTASLREFLDGLTLANVATTVVDVALVYYLIYRLLLTIRGTRAAQMVVGIVLVGAAFFVAERLELSTVSWLLDNFISYFIILIIVVFQQDIRRALGRIGQNVMPFGRRQETSQTVDEVVAAVAQLARARMGAIIVFERDATLEEFVDDATRIDAVLSRQLLVSLFVPARDNELHDGAVVIGKNHRIELARALLPLSRATDLGPEFGTRHRAALGITEDTDAVVVVVSEERGEISLCFKGSIARDLEPVMLRRALVGLFAGGRDRDMAEEAAAAAEVGKAIATLGGRRPRAETADGRRDRRRRRASVRRQRSETIGSLGPRARRAPSRRARHSPPPPPVEPPPERGAIRRWLHGALFDNLGLKFLSMVLAVTVFLLVNTDKDREITVAGRRVVHAARRQGAGVGADRRRPRHDQGLVAPAAQVRRARARSRQPRPPARARAARSRSRPT